MLTGILIWQRQVACQETNPIMVEAALMAASPRLKLYTPEGHYEGSVKCYYIAAAALGAMPDRSTIRLGHTKKNTLWTEGEDGFAGDSYDVAAQKMSEREDRLRGKGGA